MKYKWILPITSALMLMVCVACGEPEITDDPGNDPIEEPGDEPKDDPKDDPDKWVYDHDMDFDSEAYLAAYKGTPYKGPHLVPGTLEAEDFDEGAREVAYHRNNLNQPARGGYRDGHTVGIRPNGTASNGFFIGDVNGGDWIAYTIDVTQDGAYSIETWIVTNDGTPGTFYFEVDGYGASLPTTMPKGDWEDFTYKVVTENIQLTQGRHILKYCPSAAGNIDKMVFTRTGELEIPGGSSQYPMTKAMSNPLFVDFPSPMFNSRLTGSLYTADASAHVWNIDGKEILYVYASHDMEPAVGCDRMDRYHVFSTEDMVNWTDHGEIMNAATVRKQAGWGSDGFMWAPDCAYNPADQTYYFYFPHPENTANWNSTWRIGVAASKSPDKDFRVVGYVSGMPPHIDPCVFVDDDGQPYIYNGGGGKYFGGKLQKGDWTKLDGQMTQMSGLQDFHEAAWVHKYNGKYYLSHSDNNSPEKGGNNMRYAVSDSPLGPWKDMGVYMYPTGIDTNHGSLVNFKGQWWAFYHTGNYSGHGTLRSVCVDPITMRPDGTFEVVRNWGTTWDDKPAPVIAAGEELHLEAENYNKGGYHYGWFSRSSRTDAPVVRERDGRSYVEGLESGEWVRYSFVAESEGKYSVECTVSPDRSGSRYLVSLNGRHPASNGIQINDISNGEWGTVSVRDLELAAGESYLEFRVVGGSVNVDSFVITKQ